MRVSRKGTTFDITGIDDPVEARRFLIRCGFNVLDDVQPRAAQLLRAPVNQDTTEALVHDIYTWVCMNTSISKEEGKNFGRFLRERLGRR